MTVIEKKFNCQLIDPVLKRRRDEACAQISVRERGEYDVEPYWMDDGNGAFAGDLGLERGGRA